MQNFEYLNTIFVHLNFLIVFFFICEENAVKRIKFLNVPSIIDSVQHWYLCQFIRIRHSATLITKGILNKAKLRLKTMHDTIKTNALVVIWEAR